MLASVQESKRMIERGIVPSVLKMLIEAFENRNEGNCRKEKERKEPCGFVLQADRGS